MKCEVVLRENPNRVFRPGELMEGSIVIKCRNESVINEISCTILGYARCAWSLETSMYYFQTFSGRKELLNTTVLLLHKPRHGQKFPKGNHSFNFVFPLPEHLPSTFKALEGIVKYQMEITVKRFGKSDCNYVYPFNIMRVVDLNTFEDLSRPLLKVTSKEFSIDFTSKALYMTAMIPQQGFIPNQLIDVRTQIDNRSIVYVKYVKISLKKVIGFTSQNPNVQTRQQTVTEARVYCGDVPAHQKRTFLKYLKVPLLIPNINNCEIIQVNYEIQVKAKTVGVTRSPVLRLPIQIGSIPLMSENFLDYELESGMPSILRRLEIAPMSYDECMSSTATTPDGDLIDLNLPTYEEAIRESTIIETGEVGHIQQTPNEQACR